MEEEHQKPGTEKLEIGLGLLNSEVRMWDIEWCGYFRWGTGEVAGALKEEAINGSK